MLPRIMSRCSCRSVKLGTGNLQHHRDVALRRSLRCQSSVTCKVSQEGASTSETVTITYRGNTFSVAKGSRLRTAMMKNSVSPHSKNAQAINCRGIGSCGTCAVQISGAVSPPQWTTAERLRLNFPPHGPPSNERLRLARQVRCDSDLQVVKYDKFWGEGQVPLGPLAEGEFWQPLGELEFVLDPESSKAGSKRS